MTLTEIASRIQKHLDRFASDKSISRKTWTDREGKVRELTLYWHPIACRGGSRCMVKYVGYQYESSLTKAEAERYLAWLDAGNIGTHYKALEAGPT